MKEIFEPFLAPTVNVNSVKLLTILQSHPTGPHGLSHCWLLSPHKLFSTSLEHNEGKVILLDLFPLSILVIMKFLLGQMPLDNATIPVAAQALTGTWGLGQPFTPNL